MGHFTLYLGSLQGNYIGHLDLLLLIITGLSRGII